MQIIIGLREIAFENSFGLKVILGCGDIVGENNQLAGTWRESVPSEIAGINRWSQDSALNVNWLPFPCAEMSPLSYEHEHIIIA